MPGLYENKHQDSFPNVNCYVPWQSHFVLDGFLAFIFINARTLFPTSTAMSLDSRSFFSMDAWHWWKYAPGLFSQHLLLCPLTVAVCSRWMPGIYFQKRQDSFPIIYCYVPWQSQFVLDGWLALIFINPRTLFPMSTAMSPDSHSWCWKWMPGLFSQRLQLCPLTVAVDVENKWQDSFPNVYCYVPWQSQFVLDGCLAFMKISTRSLFPMSTAMSLDSRSLFSMDAWHLWK